MTIISTVAEAEATGRLGEYYAADVADQGFVASHTKVMGLNPDAYDAWQMLVRAIAALPAGPWPQVAAAVRDRPTRTHRP
jgi:hypothetical protein